MMKIIAVILTLLVITISLPIFGHDGHDHHSVYASLIHLLWLAPIFVGLSFMYSRIINQLYKIDK
jgi:hypothetical protein